MGSLSLLLQGIFPTQGSNPDLPHCRQILYQLSYQGRPIWAELSGKDLPLSLAASARLDVRWFAPRMAPSHGWSFDTGHQLTLRKGWWPQGSVSLCLGSLLWAFPEVSSWFPPVKLSWFTEQVSQENRKEEHSIFITETRESPSLTASAFYWAGQSEVLPGSKGRWQISCHLMEGV